MVVAFGIELKDFTNINAQDEGPVEYLYSLPFLFGDFSPSGALLCLFLQKSQKEAQGTLMVRL